MLKDQCISVTDLRTKTKECLENLSEKPKYIFLNNQPIAVLLNIDEYEQNFIKPELTELNKNQVSEELVNSAKITKNLQKSELINI